MTTEQQQTQVAAHSASTARPFMVRRQTSLATWRPVLSGQFSGPVAVEGGEAVDFSGSQGAISKPSGPVEQQVGDRISITGDGNVIGQGVAHE